MYWFILIVAGFFEIVWAIGIKYTDGFSKLFPSICTIVCMILSMSLLSFAARNLPIGTAYAVWTGIGVVGTVIAGVLLFNESKDPLRIIFISFIVIGIAGLKFLDK